MKRVLLTAGVCLFIVIALKALSFFDFSLRELVYSLISIVLFVAGGLFLKATQPRVPFRRFFKLQSLKRGDMKLLFHMTFLVISGSFLVNLLTITVLEALGSTVPTSSFITFNPENVWLSVLTVAVIPAIFEEFFFRGAVISALSTNKTVVAVLISAVFFAAVHGSVYYFLSNFFAGAIFAVMISVTGSLFVSVAAHFLNNILSYVLFIYSSRMTTVGFDAVVVWVIALVFLFALYNTVGAVAKKYKEQMKLDRPLINEGELIWEKRKEKK